MAEKVYIQKQGDKIKLTFHYNTDLVEIMNNFGGWYIKSERAWQFPSSILSIIRDTLKKKMYNVQFIKSKVL